MLAPWLLTALPQRTTPPQSPGLRAPTACPEVNTIGSAAVPSAITLEPRCTTKVPFVLISPIIVVPAWIV